MGPTTGPAVSAVVVINTQNESPLPGTTSLIKPDVGAAGEVAIRLDKGTLVSGAAFNIFDALGDVHIFNFGCDVTKTNTRFLNKRLRDWVPDPTLTFLFAELGIPISSASNDPIITDIGNVVCTPGDVGGTLSFDAVIQFTK